MITITQIEEFIKDNKKPIIIGSGIFVFGLGMFVWFKFFRTTNAAKRLVGIKELGVDQGFDDPKFQQEMESVGWKKGQAWCAYFVKLIWLRTHPLYRKELKYLISPSTYTLLSNFQNDDSGHYEVSDEPTKGAIVVFNGHVGIVWKVKGDVFYTIEGNYSNEVSEVEHNFSEINGTYPKFINIK